MRRQRVAVPKADGRLANLLRVGQQALAIKTGASAGHHKTVRHAARHEAAAPKRTHFYRAVDQLVVVRCRVRAKAMAINMLRAQAGGQGPTAGASGCCRCGHAQRVRGVVLTVYAQAQAGAVEEPALGIEPSRAHRRVVGIDLVGQRQRQAGCAVNAPAALVKLRDGGRMAAGFRRVLLGLQVLQVFGKFAHQIAARNPYRQADALLRRRRRNAQRDAEQVRVHVGDVYAVVDTRRGRVRRR